MERLSASLQRPDTCEGLRLLSETQGVAGLLYHHLNGPSRADAVPKPCMEELAKTYLETARQSMAVVKEAKALSTLAGRAGISIAALQGLSVLRAYGDPGLRPLGDLDILVRPEDKEALKRLLSEAGYSARSPLYPDTLTRRRIDIDIHTHILNLERIRTRREVFPPDLSPIWQDARPFFAPGDALLVLAPPDSFVALSAHALKHNYSRLVWLTDLYELVCGPCQGSDGWRGIVESARRWKQVKTVSYALLLLEDLYGLAIPPWLKTELGFERLSRMERELLRFTARGEVTRGLSLTLWASGVESMRSKIHLLGEALFPRDEVMAQVFGDAPPMSPRQRLVRRFSDVLILLSRDAFRFAGFLLKG